MSDPLRHSSKTPFQLDYQKPGKPSYRRLLRTEQVFLLFVGVPVIFLVASLVLPSLNRKRGSVYLRCPANLTNIGLACQIYANNYNNTLPATIEELVLETDLTPGVFVCPDSNDSPSPGETSAEQASHLSEGHHLSYIYVGKGLTSLDPNPGGVVVAYEHLTNHKGAGGNFLFLDGHVQWMPAAAAQPLTAAIPAARLPPAR